MTQRRALWALLAMIAVLALVAAGCGGSDSSSASGDETTIETTDETTDETSSGDETMADETMADETMADEDTTGESSDTGGSLGAFADKDCIELASIGSKLAQAVDPSGSFDAGEAATLYEQLMDKAPAEIRDDLAVFADYLKEISELLQGVDLSSGQQPSAEDLAKLEKLGSLDTTEVQKASENLAAWASENCSAG